MAIVLDSIPVDDMRLKAEHAADADVLYSLQRNGDCPSVVRAIDSDSWARTPPYVNSPRQRIALDLP